MGQLLQGRVQENADEIHLHLISDQGDCMVRLQEREGLPGFFEAMVEFTSREMGSLRLQASFSKSQCPQPQPWDVCEWHVCRQQNFPPCF